MLGVIVGGILAFLGSTILAQDMNIGLMPSDLLTAALTALLFGLVTAYAFALPALGRALQIDVAHLFRASNIDGDKISNKWRIASYIASATLVTLVLIAIPDVLFGLAFLVTVLLCIAFFEGLVKALRYLSQYMQERPWLRRHGATRMALANMHRPGTPLRLTLLSLGTALTLLVACSVIVIALLRLVQTTIPEESPALVLYNVLEEQKQSVYDITSAFDSLTELRLAPNVRGRVSGINNIGIRELAAISNKTPTSNNGHQDIDWQDMARDEHKLSYLASNIDGINIVEGRIWDANDIADLASNDKVDFAFMMEDREASQMKLSIGDTVDFTITGITRTGLLTGIYSQKGIQTRFWFEAVFSDGALDDFINAYVGTAYMNDEQALALQSQLAKRFPNIITVRTKDLLEAASKLLSKGTNGLTIISSISLLVSLMVLASVMAAGRAKQSYHAIILFSLGARLSYIRKAIIIEYALLAFVVSLFAVILGLTIAASVLQLRLKVFMADVYMYGIGIAVLSSILVFSLGALYLFQKLKIKPAILLKESV